VQRFGLEVVEGDLVALNGAQLAATEEIFEEVEEGADVNEAEPIDEIKPHTTSSTGEKEENPLNAAVHVVTKEDIASHRFSIFDVLLPLPGSSVLLPQNEIGEYCLGILTEDGLELNNFASCAVQFRTKGQYRRLMQAPGDFQWKIIEYADPDEDLAESEMATFRRSNNKRKFDYYGEGDPNDGGRSLRALQLKFSLPPGSYATMLLREITKQSTETVFQASLTSQEAALFSSNNNSNNNHKSSSDSSVGVPV